MLLLLLIINKRVFLPLAISLYYALLLKLL